MWWKIIKWIWSNSFLFGFTACSHNCFSYEFIFYFLNIVEVLRKSCLLSSTKWNWSTMYVLTRFYIFVADGDQRCFKSFGFWWQAKWWFVWYNFFSYEAHAILSDHSFDSNSVIENLQFQPTSKSRFFILLCRLFSMPLVRPTLLSDVFKLEQGFIHGYKFGSVVFYILIVNNEMEPEDIISELMNSWNVH